MADNIELDAGSGGATVAADDVGGVHYQVVKLDVGGDGASAPVSNSNPVPISDAGGAITVDGTVAVTNAGLTELAAAINASSQLDVNVAAGTVAVTHAALTELAAAIDTELQVDIVGALPAGANAIGKLAANSGVDIGDVDVTSSALPTGASTSAKQDTIITAVQLIDDPVAVLGTATYTEATTSGFVMGAVRRDADTTLVNTTNEIAPLIVDANGYLKVEIFDGGGSHTVDNAGTFAVQVDGNALTALQLIDDTIFADDAGFTLSTHKVSVLGGVAVETDGTDPTAVVEADAAALRTDRQRNLLVNITHPRFWHVSADYGAAQTNASVKAAPGASLSLYITDLVLSNGATAGNITLLDGSGGTVLFEIYPAINGGISKEFRNPIKLTANTALCITSTTVTTHSIFVSGYIAP